MSKILKFQADGEYKNIRIYDEVDIERLESNKNEYVDKILRKNKIYKKDILTYKILLIEWKRIMNELYDIYNSEPGIGMNDKDMRNVKSGVLKSVKRIDYANSYFDKAFTYIDILENNQK